MLRCLQRKETDPHFNIAAEEYLLKNTSVDIFMVWRNDPAVIIGKHQNTAREIDHSLVQDLNIPVIRRISGGGTVFHDPGNINYTFIRLNRKENPIDFKFFTQPVIHFLKSMGLNAEFEGKSNIAINGLKVSGNSAHVYKGRVLHHGTLLFNTNLELLERVIKGKDDHYQDRSVRSIRKEVSNISSHIKAEMAVEDFMESFFSFIINYYDDAYHENLSVNEYESIIYLMDEKYREPKWNYGYSPDYQYSDSWNWNEDLFTMSLETREAVIHLIKIKGPEKHSSLLKRVEKALAGTLHERNSVMEQLKSIKFVSETEGHILSQIIDHLF